MRLLACLASAPCVMALAFWAYHVNYDTQDKLDQLRALNREIGLLNEGLGVLDAEWAYLNRPDRLRRLVNLNFHDLRLLPMEPEQFGAVARIAYPAPDRETGAGPSAKAPAPVEVASRPDPDVKEDP